MKRTLSALSLGLSSLSACSSIEDNCQAYGFTPKTAAFYQCVQAETQRQQQAIQAAAQVWSQTQQSVQSARPPQPTYQQPLRCTTQRTAYGQLQSTCF